MKDHRFDSADFSKAFVSIDHDQGGGGKLLPILSFKLNPNDVLTTCKAISKGLASGFVC